MADWVTISALATAAGTLTLAVATFASVRSARQSAGVTERALLARIRPVLVATRTTDPPEKVGFVDDHWMRVEGQRAVIDLTDEGIWLAFTVRNAGAGIAVLDRWDLYTERQTGPDVTYRDPDQFTRLQRDIYVAGGDIGFWQGAFRDPSSPTYLDLRAAIEARTGLNVDLLYEDHEGGQRTITRFALIPMGDPDENGPWLTAVTRHWNLDRDDPR